MKIYIPKVPLSDKDGIPTFFLMGPIRGGGEWQVNACTLLREFFQKEEFAVIVPNRWPENHILKKYFIPGQAENTSQTVWERKGLYLAGRSAMRGCIITWLPVESKTDPRNDGSPYGRESYGEIGEWRGQMMYDDHIRFVLGAEKDFPGLEQISKNFDDALRTTFPIYPDLEMTVQAAIGIAVYRESSVPSRFY